MTSTNELLYLCLVRKGRKRSLFVSDENIDNAITEVTGFTVEELQQKIRLRTHVLPRQVGMFFYLCAGYSLEQTGIRFHRDHATVVHSRKAVMNFYGQPAEKRLTQYVDRISELTRIETGLK